MNRYAPSLVLLAILASSPASSETLARDPKTKRLVVVESGTIQLRQEAKGAKAIQPLASVSVPASTPQLAYTKYCGGVDHLTSDPNEVFVGLVRETAKNIDDAVPERVWVVQFEPPAIKETKAPQSFMCDNPWAVTE